MITVHGKETARLVPVPEQRNKIDKEKWLRDLDKLRKENWTGRYGKSAQEIQDEDRADRFWSMGFWDNSALLNRY